ncbi:MAG: T9SS type A sorting domain-containing protein [Candidatus Kapaibacterium sp.]
MISRIHKVLLLILLLNARGLQAESPGWSTYYGGNNYDGITSVICVGDEIYACGFTNTDATGIIATEGAHKSKFTGSTGTSDAFLVKFDKTGQRLWATYFGGTQNDRALALTYDKVNGHIIMGGTTSSHLDIAFGSGIEQNIYGGGSSDGFLAAFDPYGSLKWSTYFGGTGNDTINDLACEDGRLYVVGTTTSHALATPGVHQQNLRGFSDAFFSVFESDKGLMEWTSYYGGSGSSPYTGGGAEQGTAVSVNGDDIYFAGNTNSVNGIHYNNGPGRTFSGAVDGFIVKIQKNKFVEWGSYFGGGNSDAITAIHASGSDIYLTGITLSNSLQGSINSAGGNTDSFLCRIDGKGEIDWTVFLGGDDDDIAHDLIVEKYIYVAGFTKSNMGIATKGATKSNLNGNTDGFLAAYEENGNSYFGTYLGAGLEDEIRSIAYLESDSIMVMAGVTNSEQGISTTNSHQRNFGGTTDGFIQINNLLNIIPELSEYFYCSGDSIEVDVTLFGNFSDNTVLRLELSDPLGSFDNPYVLAAVSANTSTSIKAMIPVDISSGGDYYLRVVSSYKDIIRVIQEPVSISNLNNIYILGIEKCCIGDKEKYFVNSTGLSNLKWKVEGGEIAGDIFDNNIDIIWTEYGINKIELELENAYCKGVVMLEVEVFEKPEAEINEFSDICDNDKLFKLTGAYPAGGNYFVNGKPQSTFNPTAEGPGIYEISYIYQNFRGCADTAFTELTVLKSPEKPDIILKDDFIFTTSEGEKKWYYNGSKIVNATGDTLWPQNSGSYFLTVENLNGCISDNSDTIDFKRTINKYPAITVTDAYQFEDLICNEMDESVLSVKNTGTDTLVINNIYLKGAQHFLLNTGFVNSILAPDSSTSIGLYYIPVNTGVHTDTIVIKSNAVNTDSSLIIIKGTKHIADFQIDRIMIDHGRLEYNIQDTLTLAIKNTGTTPLYLNASLDSELFRIEGKLDSIVNESVISVVFRGYYSDTLITAAANFTDSTCGNSMEVSLRAEVFEEKVSPPGLYVQGGFARASAGDTLEMNISIHPINWLRNHGYEKITGELNFNYTLLYPVGDTPEGYVHSGRRYIPLDINFSEAEDFKLKFRAALGTDSITRLRFDNLAVEGYDRVINHSPGIFILNDLCLEGGPRYVHFEDAINMEVFPNPAKNKLNLKFDLIESGHTEILIFNYLGEPVLKIFDAKGSKGEHDIDINIATLSSGVYYIRLETPTFSETSLLNIVK